MEESEDIMVTLDKLDAEAERLGNWQELLEVAVDAYDDYNKTETYADKVCYPQQFLFRLYHRVKYFDKQRDFNIVYETARFKLNEEVKLIAIENYDYKTFLWCVKHDLTFLMDNLTVYIPFDKLTEKQLTAFKDKIKK